MGKRERKSLRFKLWYEQAGWCGYCDQWVPKDQATLDHIAPRAIGGPDTWGNCLMACERCNEFKADHIPDFLGMGPIVPDRRKPRDADQRRRHVRFMKWLRENPTPVGSGAS